MAKKRKILEKILRGSKNIHFHEFITLIAAFGFALNRINGSHHIFEHPTLRLGVTIQPDKNNQAKDYQIKQFLKLIEKFDLKMEDSHDEEE